MSDWQFLPILLLVLLGTVGVADIAWYHVWKFRLYSQPSSRGEQVTHLLRNILFTVVLALLLRYRPEGAWFWGIAAALAVDFANSVADALIEPGSRAPLGGLPPLEYLVHVITSTISGGVTVAFVVTGWVDGTLTTALVARPDHFLPAPLAIDAWFVVLGAAGFFAVEGGLFARSLITGRVATPPPAKT